MRGFTRAKPCPYVLMQLKTLERCNKQEANRKSNGQPLKQMAVLASQHVQTKSKVGSRIAGDHNELQSTLVISTSLISNNRLSRI